MLNNNSSDSDDSEKSSSSSNSNVILRIKKSKLSNGFFKNIMKKKNTIYSSDGSESFSDEEVNAVTTHDSDDEDRSIKNSLETMTGNNKLRKRK
ncbi:hypothetical protein ILUMI_02256, partial [Ignelater luminosus]